MAATRKAWLTPDDDPASLGSVCRTIRIPNAPDWLGPVTGAFLLLSDPANWEQHGAVTPEDAAGYFDAQFEQFIARKVCMIGAILPYARDTAPDGALLCDGATYDAADYPLLYDVLPAAMKTATEFTVPDLRDRFIMGGEVADVATQGGEAEHTLTEAEMPAHIHTSPPHAHSVQANLQSGLIGDVSALVMQYFFQLTSATAVTIDPAGGDQPHNNLPPYYVLAYYIVTE